MKVVLRDPGGERMKEDSCFSHSDLPCRNIFQSSGTRCQKRCCVPPAAAAREHCWTTHACCPRSAAGLPANQPSTAVLSAIAIKSPPNIAECCCPARETRPLYTSVSKGGIPVLQPPLSAQRSHPR